MPAYRRIHPSVEKSWGLVTSPMGHRSDESADEAQEFGPVIVRVSDLSDQ